MSVIPDNYALCSQVSKPLYIMGRDLPHLLGVSRSSLVFFSEEEVSSAKVLNIYKPSVDPLDRSGHLKWFENSSWESSSLEPNDRVVVALDTMGSKLNLLKIPSSCHGNAKVANSVGIQVGWLASCGLDLTSKISTVPEVSYSAIDTKLETRDYSYIYKKDNNMLFESVTLKGKKTVPVAFDSDLIVRSDVKNFFTLQFDSSDIQSKMIHVRHNHMASLATLDFYLKILFFKITLDLQTDVSFYGSSAHIPMVLTVPVDARKYLHSRSGVLYSFAIPEGVAVTSSLTMPLLDMNQYDASEFKPNVNKCTVDPCQYELHFAADGRSLVMGLAIPRSLVAYGMYPQFASNVQESAVNMGWKLTDKQMTQRRAGIYFEMSGLPKGEHGWDFWMIVPPQ